jgi:thermitase
MRIKSILRLFILALAFARSGQAAEVENFVRWDAGSDSVSADVHHQQLWPVLEGVARQTGWHIFVEPDTARFIDVKFQNEPRPNALKKLLGDLSFAFVPKTNEPSQLYVFTSRMENATRPVNATNAVAKARPSHVPNQLMVKLKPGANIDALAKSLGAKVVGRDDKNGIYLLEFPDAAATETARASLKNNSEVAAVDYNYLYDPPVAPRLLANANLAPVALKLDTSKAGDPCNPVIGLIDTRIQPLGSQLDPFVLQTVSIAGEVTPNANAPTHATSMAETILRAVAQSSGGSSAVKILPIDVYGANETATTWNLALGVKAAVDGGATVLNMSLGGTSESAILDDIIRQAQAKGVIIFAAAGNQPVNTATFPAAISGVNAVTALDAPGQLAPYANYGSFVSMALPGSSVVYLGNQAFVVNGTSPATAYASGIAAGTKGVDCLPWSQIQAAMQQKFPVPQN